MKTDGQNSSEKMSDMYLDNRRKYFCSNHQGMTAVWLSATHSTRIEETGESNYHIVHAQEVTVSLTSTDP